MSGCNFAFQWHVDHFVTYYFSLFNVLCNVLSLYFIFISFINNMSIFGYFELWLEGRLWWWKIEWMKSTVYIRNFSFYTFSCEKCLTILKCCTYCFIILFVVSMFLFMYKAKATKMKYLSLASRYDWYD